MPPKNNLERRFGRACGPVWIDVKDSASPTVINGADYDSFASDALLYNITGEALRKAGLKRFGLYRNETETVLDLLCSALQTAGVPPPRIFDFFVVAMGTQKKHVHSA